MLSRLHFFHPQILERSTLLLSCSLCSSETSFFPSIGSLAANANARPDIDDALILDDDAQMEVEEREVQEIESLCMSCHEQVRLASG